MSAALVCPKCNGGMQEGLTLEFTSHASSAVSQWLEGVPERGFLFGLRTRGKTRLPIKTFRCTSCGYLESYAKSD